MESLKPQEIIFPERIIDLDGRKIKMRPLSAREELGNMRAISVIAQTLTMQLTDNDGNIRDMTMLSMADIALLLETITREIIDLLELVCDTDFRDMGGGAVYVLAVNFIEMNFHRNWLERFLLYMGALKNMATSLNILQPQSNDLLQSSPSKPDETPQGEGLHQ